MAITKLPSAFQKWQTNPAVVTYMDADQSGTGQEGKIGGDRHASRMEVGVMWSVMAMIFWLVFTELGYGAIVSAPLGFVAVPVFSMVVVPVFIAAIHISRKIGVCPACSTD
jgi:hypothetical protein